MELKALRIELQKMADPDKAKDCQRFFKTGKGEYGEGDVFLGIVVPEQRKIAKKFVGLNFSELQELIESQIHEERLTALFILVNKYKKASEDEKRDIYNFYLKNAKQINNWDLVDLSAPTIVGDFLFDKNKDILYKLANSDNLWEKRIAILATFWFIREGKFGDSLKIAKILLHDKYDLIHKAVGWMLREIGKRDLEAEEEFLQKHYKEMPRTMLRYAIEKFPEGKRRDYLEGQI